MEIKREVIHVPMETEIEQTSVNKSYVSPVALELNKLIQQGQQDGIFKIPAGVGLPASETSESSDVGAFLAKSSATTSISVGEARTISSMDISDGSSTSSISANAPMLASLLVKEPEAIQSPTLLPQSPSGQQNTTDIPAFLQSPQSDLAQLLQSPVGQEKPSLVPQTPDEISKFIHESPLGQQDSVQSADDGQNLSFIQRSASPPPPQTDVSQYLLHIPESTVSNASPAQSSASNQISIEASPMFVQQSQMVQPPASMASQTTDVSQFLQQQAPLSPVNNFPSTPSEISQFLHQSPLGQQEQSTVDVSQFLQQQTPVNSQSQPSTNIPTFLQQPFQTIGGMTTVQALSQPQVISSSILEQQTPAVNVPTSTDVSHFLQQVALSQPSSNVSLQTSTVTDVTRLLQSSSTVSGLTFAVLSTSAPMVQQTAPIMVQQTTPIMMTTPILVQQPAPQVNQQPAAPMMQQPAQPLIQQQMSPMMQSQGSPVGQQSTDPVQQTPTVVSSIPNNEQEVVASQTLQQASATIDQIVSKCQQDDVLQQNGNFMESSTNSLPSISLEDVDDILKNNLS